MKKIYNVLFVLMALVSFASCSNDIDETFDKSSSERINETMAECKNVLTSAQNGWLMKYYPKANTQYGGYNVLVKFDADGNVTAMSDALESDTKATSHYKLEQSSGVVLSFDEYNKVIHFFSDPANPAGIGNNGKGMEGDLEFRMQTACADSVVMLGKKRNAKIVMTPLAQDADWAKIVDGMVDMENDMAFPSYQMEVNGAQYMATTSYRTMTFTRQDAEEDLVTMPYIVTQTGIEFYSPVTLNGETIKGFNYVGGDNYEFDATDGSAVKMYGLVPPISEQVINGDWFFSVANMGTYAQTYWNKANTQVSQHYSPCYFVALTTSAFDGYTGHWGMFANVAGYGSFIDLTPSFVDDDHIELSCAHKFGLNGQYFYQWGQVYMTHSLTGDTGNAANKVSVTYKVDLVEGTLRSPSAIKLTDTENADNWYVLTREMPDSPF